MKVLILLTLVIIPLTSMAQFRDPSFEQDPAISASIQFINSLEAEIKIKGSLALQSNGGKNWQYSSDALMKIKSKIDGQFTEFNKCLRAKTCSDNQINNMQKTKKYLEANKQKLNTIDSMCCGSTSFSNSELNRFSASGENMLMEAEKNKNQIKQMRILADKAQKEAKARKEEEEIKNKIHALNNELEKLPKGPNQCSSDEEHENRFGLGICGNVHIMNIFGASVGLECLESTNTTYKDFFRGGIEVDCFCSGGVASNINVGSNAATGASVSAVGIMTFGNCDAAESYEGGFFNTGFATSAPINGVEVDLGFNLGTGLDLKGMSKSIEDLKNEGPESSEVKRKNFLLQMKTLLKTVAQSGAAEAQDALLVSVTMSAAIFKDDPALIGSLVASAFPSLVTNPSALKEKVEGLLNISKNPLNLYQRPLERILNKINDPNTPFGLLYKQNIEHACREEFDHGNCQQMSDNKMEINHFFKDMLYDKTGKNLGKGFLGTCHAISASAGVGVSTPAINKLKISPTVGYTTYAHIAKVKIGIAQLAELAMPGISSLSKLGIKNEGETCSPISKEQAAEAKEWFGSNSFKIKNDIANQCKNAVSHGFTDVADVARSLMSAEEKNQIAINDKKDLERDIEMDIEKRQQVKLDSASVRREVLDFKLRKKEFYKN